MMECVAKISTVKGTLAKNLVMKSHVVIVKSRSIRVSERRKGPKRPFCNIGIRRGISRQYHVDFLSFPLFNST